MLFVLSREILKHTTNQIKKMRKFEQLEKGVRNTARWEISGR